MTDNENVFTSVVAKSIYERLKIQHTTTPIHHSTTNSQVERIHGTLIEISTALAQQNNSSPRDELFNAVKQYNKTIHSTTGYRPEDVFFNRERYPDIKGTLEHKQEKLLNYHNKNRHPINYKEGDLIYAKTHRRNKNNIKYSQHKVKEDRGDTILTAKGKIIHKDNIRRQATQCTNQQDL